MSNRRRKNSPPKTSRNAHAAATHTVETERHGDYANREILKKFLRNILNVVFLWIVLFGVVESWPWVQDLKWRAFRTLEGHPVFSQPLPSAAQFPVIIDISTLPPQKDPQSNEVFTPREELEKILWDLTCRTIWEPKHPPPRCEDPLPAPAAIGLDIDFSPEGPEDSWRFVDPANDQNFFKFCWNLGAPVFLGVFRTVHLPPDQWLGLPEYKRLAAALPIEERPRTFLKTTRDAPTLASALASAYLALHPATPPETSNWREFWHERLAPLRDIFLERDSETDLFGVNNTINYRAIDHIVAIPYCTITGTITDKCNGNDERNLETYHKIGLEGKIVIIGDVKRDRTEQRKPDLFSVPIEKDQVGGVQVQAAAAYTMVDPNARLWALRTPWEVTADLFLSVLIYGAIAIYEVWHGKLRERFERIAVACLPVVVIIFGWLINRWVIWDGCVVVALSLAIDPIQDFIKGSRSV